MTRHRVLPMLKLLCTLLCALIAAAAFVNRYDWFDFDNRQLALRLSGGSFAITWSDTTPLPTRPILFGLLQSEPRPNSRELWHVRFPLWPLLLALAVPTLWLWRLDRPRIKPPPEPPPSPQPIQPQSFPPLPPRPTGQPLIRKRTRKRRVLKRIATAAFLLAALALILSTQRTASLTEPTGRLACALSRGTLLLFVSRHPITITRPNAELIELATTAWHGSFAAGELGPAWPKYRTYGANSLKVVLVPLSSLLIVLALVSAGLWLYDLRRPRRGICPQCDYNLTGNTSGICPECGYAIAQPP